MKYVALILFVIFFAMQFMDVYTTLRILHAGGKELNPVMNWCIRKMGVVPGLVVPKIVMLCLVAVFVLPSWLWMLVIVLIYGWVINHNWQQMSKRSG